MVYTQGYERLPENWYRMPTDYDLGPFNEDILYFASLYPELLRYVYQNDIPFYIIANTFTIVLVETRVVSIVSPGSTPPTYPEVLLMRPPCWRQTTSCA